MKIVKHVDGRIEAEGTPSELAEFVKATAAPVFSLTAPVVHYFPYQPPAPAPLPWWYQPYESFL